jgi:hypothetical protein
MNREINLVKEERVSSLFQPDTLLHAQYLETFRKKVRFEPERRLMLAVLEEAVMCFQKYLLAPEDRRRRCFARLRSGYWKKMATGRFLLKTSARSWD